MASEAFTDLTTAPAPGFRCYAAGKKSDAKFVAGLRHILTPPASSESLAQIQKMLSGHADQMSTFYKLHDGCVLYRDTKSAAAGIELLPVGQWEAATAD